MYCFLRTFDDFCTCRRLFSAQLILQWGAWGHGHRIPPRPWFSDQKVSQHIPQEPAGVMSYVASFDAVEQGSGYFPVAVGPAPAMTPVAMTPVAMTPMTPQVVMRAVSPVRARAPSPVRVRAVSPVRRMSAPVLPPHMPEVALGPSAQAPALVPGNVPPASAGFASMGASSLIVPVYAPPAPGPAQFPAQFQAPFPAQFHPDGEDMQEVFQLGDACSQAQMKWCRMNGWLIETC
eukprot:Skav229560  [mRNA]  locus=scaffold568:488998:489699:+ [translate_table: standard]